jgi:CheY-like chemotaxis protein/FtsZ-binding cell division protein ZapB
MPILRIHLPNQGEVTHELSGDRVTIGRKPDNTIQIVDRSVSAHHAELIASEGHYRLRDLKSTNLTFVDGMPVTDYHLHTACRLSFGGIDCEFDPMATAAEMQFTREQLERDAAFLREENAGLRGTINALQRRIDILSSARLVTGRTETTPFAAANDSFKAVCAERDDLRHQNTGLILELENLHEQLTAVGRELDAAKRARDNLSSEKVALARELREIRGPMEAAPTEIIKPPVVTDANATQKLVLPIDEAFQPIPETLVSMRAALDGLAATPDDANARANLRALAGELIDRTSMLQEHPISRVASSVEALLHDLLSRPEPLDSTTVRTIMQAIDLIERLLEPRNVERAKSLPAGSVLAIDDDADLLATVVTSLELAHLQITSCADAGRVLAEAAGKRFDLVLLDFDLAGSDGPSLCARLRDEAAYRKTPIIFLTGDGSRDLGAQSSLNGGSDFISKPVNTAELTVKAQTWILRNQFGLL